MQQHQKLVLFILSFRTQLLFALIGMTAFAFSSRSFAQSVYSHKGYDWEAQPTLYSLTDEESKSAAVIVKDIRTIEFAYDDTLGMLMLYETNHKIVRVNDDAGVEEYNKVYVPMVNVLGFEELKARAITPAGKVVELNKNNIKEIKDVEEYGSFKIFAIEGVEKGGEIEYLYTIKSAVSNPYGREMIQTDVLVKEVQITIISPDNLVFEAQSYNGFPDLELERTDSTRILQATATNIPALLTEEYSAYRANLMRVDYKVSYNLASQNEVKRLYSWEEASENFANLLYDYTPDEQKTVKAQLAKLKLKKLKTPQKVIAIEQFIKTTISVEEGSGPDYTEVGRILVNRYASELGIARVFAAFFKEAGIDHNLVITSDRFKSRFDDEFESWNNFTDIIFHIAATDKYVAPGMPQFRYGAAPYQLANNYGLFITEAKKAAEVKWIPMPNAEYSTNNITANITFDKGFMPTVKVKHGWTGYRGAEYRMITQFRKEVFVQAVTLSGMEDAKQTNVQLFNEDLQNSAYPDKEFYITSQMVVPSLTEKAGKNWLFKLGNIIGPQVELYQQHERQNDIDMEYPVYYRRTIQFTVPDGYTVKGLETAIIDHFVEQDGVKTQRFVSGYQVNGKEVTITADEYYQTCSLPRTMYEPFRKVINAAADFNKVVLVFEKE
ncbi:MAG TPA: DUF3857 domain-containing protein [Chitinophagales bacterium]|nr:DUF3857 domain-containing protein [Chitinophagales bacterium]